MFSSSVFKTDPSNLTSSVSRMHVGVTVAVLHSVLKTRVAETKVLGDGILTFYTFTCSLRCYLVPFLFWTLGTRILASNECSSL